MCYSACKTWILFLIAISNRDIIADFVAEYFSAESLASSLPLRVFNHESDETHENQRELSESSRKIREVNGNRVWEQSIDTGIARYFPRFY